MAGNAPLRLVMFGIVALSVGSLRAEQITVKDPGTFVVDQAGIIDDAIERRLEGWLKELEQKTTAQVKVLTVRTTGDEDFFGFVQRHATLWNLGRKGKDNGALIVVALKNRKVRIHTGYGLEGPLPDAWCKGIVDDVFVASFRSGRFSDGIYTGVVMTANKVAGEYKVQLSGAPKFKYDPRRGGRRGRRRGVIPFCGGGAVPFIVVMVIVSSLSRRRRHHGRWGGGGGMLGGLVLGSILSSALRGGGSSHWGGGGGGFGGGGFGGGSFGGGGGFGGGGAGGSW